MYKWIMSIFFLMGIILSSGCIQEKPKNTSALAPSVDIQATVISLHLDESLYEGDSEEPSPRDRAILRIDVINSTNDPRHCIPLSVGEKINAFFRYSARPAKIKRDVIYDETKNRVEGDYIIYTIPSSRKREVVLPGLEEGSKIGVKIFPPQIFLPGVRIINDYRSVDVGVYEIIQ